jgi:glyoxylase-like metal-dependent hydrolase (beta-lactamase superfamily II)
MKKLYLIPAETGRITEGLYAVNVGTVSFYVYRGEDCLICFDTGYGRLAIRQELRSLHIDPKQVTHVFLTHADIDHTSGLSLFSGRKTIQEKVRCPRIRRAYTLLGDGETVSAGSATVQAIATPGHTPGSMSFILNDTMLFVGDACKLRDGKIFAGRHYTMDMDKQDESIRKLAHLKGIRFTMTAHAGFSADFDAAFADWCGVER